MVEILAIAYAAKHKRRDSHAKLFLQDQLFLTLKYLCQYVTQKELSYEFEVGEATTHDVIVWVENSLAKSKKFSLLGRGALLEHPEIEIALIDATESPIERPKKTNDDGIAVKRDVTP
ncbi:MAG: transposase family protein [Candidatus Bathyarchaeota archaeon]|nr:transposase family protein [Candidatus Termiticorpusculum sp.]